MVCCRVVKNSCRRERAEEHQSDAQVIEAGRDRREKRSEGQNG